jgi:hypothetical protein
VNEINKSHENALNEPKNKLIKFPSDELDKVLSCQKGHGDKSEIGFMNASSYVPFNLCVENTSDKKVVFANTSSNK